MAADGGVRNAEAQTKNDRVEDLFESVNRKILDEVPEVSHTFIEPHAPRGSRAERRC